MKRRWLCSKFTYKYQKRSEHDLSYISKLVFLDARQPPPPPPPPHPTTFRSIYLQNIFPIYIVTPKLVMVNRRLNPRPSSPHPNPAAPKIMNASLSIRPGYITGIPYVSNQTDCNEQNLKAWLSVWREVELPQVWFEYWAVHCYWFHSVWDIVTILDDVFSEAICANSSCSMATTFRNR